MSAALPSRGARWAIAHRGASEVCPENTVAAFDEALAQSCDAIELDLQLSRDGVPVVYHDRTLHKIGGGRRRVSSVDLTELRRLDAGSWFGPSFAGERVPVLAEVLERYVGRTRLLLELKVRSGTGGGRRLVHLVARHVRAAGSTDQVALLCFDPEALAEAADAAPELPRVLNVGRSTPRGLITAERPGLLAALAVDVRALDRPLVAALRQEVGTLLVYTCNHRASLRRALAAGAAGVMSDRPGWLRDALTAEGSRG